MQQIPVYDGMGFTFQTINAALAAGTNTISCAVNPTGYLKHITMVAFQYTGTITSVSFSRQ